jgi:hypothetical protein
VSPVQAEQSLYSILKSSVSAMIKRDVDYTAQMIVFVRFVPQENLLYGDIVRLVHFKHIAQIMERRIASFASEKLIKQDPVVMLYWKIVLLALLDIPLEMCVFVIQDFI